jgi:electron transport complex protein RnfE
MTKIQNLTKGFFKENPIFVYLLGMCPSLAVTSSFETSLGMGLLVILVLTSSNIVVSMFKNYIPDQVRTPAYIVIIATFVTIISMLTEAFAIELFDSLGVFIPLIVVNCLILGRAEAFASKNNVVDSAIDGFGMGLGFTLGLIIIGLTREMLATGGVMYGVYLPFFVDSPITLFSFDWIINLFTDGFVISDYGIKIFSLPPGAFISIGLLLAIFNYKNVKKAKVAEIAKKKKIEGLKKAAMAKKIAAVKLAKAGGE